MIVCDARTFIFATEVIQKVYNFFLIKEWNRGKGRAAKRVLKENTKPAVRFEHGWRALKNVFGPAINGLGDNISHRFSQHIFLSPSADLLSHGLRADHFHQMMVEKWNSAFDRMGHLHAVA